METKSKEKDKDAHTNFYIQEKNSESGTIQ